MHILLTGATGFSGSHLLKFLIKEKYAVTVLSRKPLAQQFSGEKINYLQHDLKDLKQIPKDIDVIIHTAATSPTVNTSATNFTFDNILATQNLAELATQNKIKKFIFFSSLSVFGTINDKVVNEEAPIINPCSYGASKLFGECLLKEQKDYQAIAIRLPAVIGNGAKRHWLANTIKKAQNNEEIAIYNPTAIFNNAIHINTLSNFVIELIQQNLTKNFDMVTVASKQGLPIEHIVKKIIEKTGSKSKRIIGKTEKIPFTVSSDYARNMYNYRPDNFEDILDQYLNEINASMNLTVN